MKKLIYNFILIAMLLWGAVLPAQVVLLALDAPYFTATKTETAGKTFYRNNCGSGYTGGSRYVSRTATATATSTISQADAESKASTQAYNNALALVNSQGQSEANTYGTCTYNGGSGGGGGTIYTATRQASYSGTFTKNNCPAGQTGTQVTYTTPTYTETRTSTVSQADANNLAQNAANAKAQADLNANGQTYANNNGTCIGNVGGCSAIPSFHPFHKVTRGNYKADGTFADPYTGEGSVYLEWNDASNYIFPAGYHLPTRAEWRTIVPDNDVWKMGNNNTKLNVLEYHQFGKLNQSSTQYKTFRADYYKASDGTLYGIRFKPSNQTSGNFTPNTNKDYVTAYRYINLSDRILVDINYIGVSSISISDITNASYWENTSCKDAFIFLKKGYYSSRSLNNFIGGNAWYWMADTYGFNEELGDNSGIWWSNTTGFEGDYLDYYDTIRLFKD